MLRTRASLMGLLAVVVTAATAPAAPARPLVTGLIDGTGAFGGPEAELAFERATAAGAGTIRMGVSWLEAAPRRPADPTNPDDPAYRWGSVDRRVRLAAAHGLEPLVYVMHLPKWAETSDRDGNARPRPEDLAAFGAAMARRYSGAAGGLPRVRHWQVWNEPNLDYYLVQNGTAGVAHYRDMVNAYADAVKGVAADNVVVAGGTAPFSGNSTQTWGTPALTFMSRLLCTSAGRRPKRTCDARVRFDVWAHHPYTAGGPLHRAQRRGDVSLGDLPAMRRLLVAAERAGRVRAAGRAGFWVTEFSWDSGPPDPGGVPAREHARWVAEALYRMWRNGVSTVVWFGLRDAPAPNRVSWGETYHCGLWYRGGDSLRDDRPKPALRAFRFPFVALPAGRGRVAVWGRTPDSRPGRVTVQRRVRGRWRSVASLRADRYGIFRRTLATRSRAPLRAEVRGEASAGFEPRRTRDRRVNPFGGDEPEPVTPKPD
jgi:Cellulase (glycosyl hydrolase family 5)